MSSRLAEALVRRVVSIVDPQLRVAMLRELLPKISGDELHTAVDAIRTAAAMRDSAAQVTLLALMEASTVLAGGRPSSEAPSGEAENIDTTPYRADWGTGRPLTLGERKSLARRPDRKLLERALRDGHPDVVSELLVNPRLTELDVARMCAGPDARAEVIERVFAVPRWMARPRVRNAIVGNRRAPLEIALALVPLLSRAELRSIAADTRLHRKVRSSALDVLRKLPPIRALSNEVH